MPRFTRFVLSAAVLSVGLLSGRPVATGEGAEVVGASTDAVWLEKLVTSWDAGSSLARPGTLAGGIKDVRTSAFARLGQLGTPESLAAVRRIEDATRKAWRQRTMRFDRWTHPCWHFADFQEEQKVAMLSVGGGLTYAIVNDSGLMGDEDWFLLSAPSSRYAEWQGAWLIPKPDSATARAFNLVFSQGGGVLIAFTKRAETLLEPLNPVAGGVVPKIRLDGVSKLISVKEVLQDSDDDGWSDLEEERLGLDAHNIDSDGDHLPDGSDPCPNYAADPKDATDEDLGILQKALFATFGLSGSRNLIFVNDGSRRLQVWGYDGTFLYGVNRTKWTQHHSAGIWVDWKIASRNESEAEVDIQDYEGPTAAGGQTVTLRRIAGAWYVVKRTTGPVS
jgi:hypothetical protein